MTDWQTVLFLAAWLVVAIHVVILVLVWHALVTQSYQQYINKDDQPHE